MRLQGEGSTHKPRRDLRRKSHLSAIGLDFHPPEWRKKKITNNNPISVVQTYMTLL